MWARLVSLAACLLVVLGEDLHWEAAFSTRRDAAPEPRSFASMAGLPDSSILIMLGGYSHARREWLNEVWSLNVSNPSWKQLQLQSGMETVPVEFPVLVSLGGSVLLVGGSFNGTDTRATDIFKLDLSSRRWGKAPLKVNGTLGEPLPGLYRHSAVAYTVGGSERVLLCGGIDQGSTSASRRAYELSYEAANETYSLATLPDMPLALIGHTLVAAGDSTVYLVGGLKDYTPTRGPSGLPAGLAAAMRTSPNRDVYRFNRGWNNWTRIEGVSLPRAYAYHASWLKGSSLYVYGGVQYAEANGTYGLAVLELTPGNVTHNASAVREANDAWGAVQPGAISGAAVWVDSSTTAQGRPAVWLFGGIATPWPLPVLADTYFSPQDSSLTWRLGDVGGPNASAVTAGPGRWLAPIPGRMAPRSGAMVVPVTVDGQPKLLSLGGRSLAGWTGAPGDGGPSLAPQLKNTESFNLSPIASQAARSSYQLYDMWIIDPQSGDLAPVWYVNGTTVGAVQQCSGAPSGGCVSPPFGSATSAAWLGRLWDRRLLPFSAGGGASNGSNSAIYLHTEEVPNSINVAGGIWLLTLSTTTLTTAADGPLRAYVATWQLLSGTSVSATTTFYPRLMYGAAHMTSSATSSVSYLALSGGLALIELSGSWMVKETNVSKTDTVLLEITRGGCRWLKPPGFPEGGAPEPRYRHACAPLPGLSDFSMTCFGGLSSQNSSTLLGDAWTLAVKSGFERNLDEYSGAAWISAPEDVAAVRPGQRVDAFLVPLRGGDGSAVWRPIDYSPLLLVGGWLSAAVDTPRSDAWLLDAASCFEPAVEVPKAVVDTNLPRPMMQLWQSVVPKGSLAEEALLLGLSSEWRVASVMGVVEAQSNPTTMWFLLSPAEDEIADLYFVKMVSPSSPSAGGCLSPAVRPSCDSSYIYAKDTTMAGDCRPGTTRSTITVKRGSGSGPGVLPDTVGFLVQDADGVGVHVTGVTQRATESTINGVQLPDGQPASGLRVLSYGKPFVPIDVAAVKTDPATASVEVAFRTQKMLLRVMASSTTPAVNTTLELRGRYNALYRSTGHPRATTNGTGYASFDGVFPIQEKDVATVSYAVIVTPASSTPSVVPLETPASKAARSTVEVLRTGMSVVLEPGSPHGADVSYIVYLSKTSSTVPLFANVTLKAPAPPGVVVPYPSKAGGSRKWFMLFFYKGDYTPAFCVSGLYNMRTNTSVSPGQYSVQVVDGLVPNPTLMPVGDVELNGASGPLDVVVNMSSVTLDVRFANVTYGSLTGDRGARHMTVRLSQERKDNDEGYEITSGKGKGCEELLPADNAWDEQLMNNRATFMLKPELTYTAEFYYQDNPYSLLNFSFSSGSRNSTWTQDVPLPQTLLCQPQPDATVIRSTKGRVTAGGDATRPAVYAPGSKCGWSFQTGQPILRLGVNCSGLPPYYALVATYGSNEKTCESYSLGASTTWEFELNLANVTLWLNDTRSMYGATCDSFIAPAVLFWWEARPRADSMKPQFIMMIAAASAALGALLLFVCLWYCVFRPVQLRRQAAAAMAAAANAAAANTAAGGAAGGRGAGHRSRVPRRYLRMMETTTYSAKDVMKAATSATAAVGNGNGNANRNTAPAATAAATAAAVNVGDNRNASGGVGPVFGSPKGAMAVEPTASQGESPREGIGAVQAPAVQAPALRADAAVAPSKDVPPASEGASQSEPEGTGGEVCSICLCEFEEGDRIKHLPCRHFYHVPCIDQWLGRDITCPLCKDNVLDAMRTLFGPLPPRGSHRQGSRLLSASGGGGGTATADAAVPPTPGGVAGTGADVEMVIIVAQGPPGAPTGNAFAVAAADATPAAAAASSGGGAVSWVPQAAGPRSAAGPLPGRVGSDLWDRDAAMTARSLAVAATPGAGTAVGGVTATVSRRSSGSPVVDAAPGADAAAAAARAAAAATAAGADAAGAQALLALRSQSTGGNSRELRPMHRNISADLTPDPASTTTESESDSGSDATATRNGNRSTRNRNGNRNRNNDAGVNSGTATPGGGGGGNQSMGTGPPTPAPQAPVLAGVTVPYIEVGAPSPNPRPVVEHTQHSLTSSSAGSTAMRWLGGASAQVMPMPRPPMTTTSASAVPSPHRRPRAQEAQLAAAAAALTAAAAGVNSGGNSWRTASMTSTGTGDGAAVLRASHSAATIAAAAAAASFIAAHPNLPPPPLDVCPSAILAYRVHTNPLALSQRSGTTTGGSFTTTEDGPNPASPRAHGSVASAAAAAAPPPQLTAAAASPSVLVLQSGPVPHVVSVLSAGGGATTSASAAASAGPSWLGRSRCSSSSSADTAGGGGAGRHAGGTLAVPEVAASSEDFIRSPSSKPGVGPNGVGSGGGGGGGGAH